MNVAQIVREVENELQFAPDIDEWDTDIRQVLRREYTLLQRTKRWPFFMRETPMTVLPDVTFPNAQVGLSAGRLRLLSFTWANAITAGLFPAEDVEAKQEINGLLHGAMFGLADMTLRDQGNGNWHEGPFVIDRSDNLLASSADFWLEQKAVIGTIDGDEGDWKLEFPRWRLPGDCDIIHAITDKDGRKLDYIEPEEYDRLSRAGTDQTGTPRYFTMDEGLPIRFGVPEADVDRLTVLRAPLNNEVKHLRNAVITQDFTAAPSAGTGNYFIVGETYTFFCSWMYAGRFGPPSKEVEVTITSGNQRVTLSSLPVLPESASVAGEVDSGWRLSIWVRRGNGAFILLDIPDTPSVTPVGVHQNDTFIGISPFGEFEPYRRVRWDEIYAPRYKYVKLWPRPGAMTQLRLRYRARTPQLLEESDEPWFDEGFHDLLVWKTAAAIASRRDNERFVRRCRKNAKEVLDALIGRYMPREARDSQRRQIDRPRVLRSQFDLPLNYQGDS